MNPALPSRDRAYRTLFSKGNTNRVDTQACIHKAAPLVSLYNVDCLPASVLFLVLFEISELY